MDRHTYIISFAGISDADANRYASELRGILLDTVTDIQVEQRRDDPRTQDLGTILVLILGTSSVTAIAKAVGDWLKLRNSASLTVKTSEGYILMNNVTSKDATKLAELLTPKK
jgi:hypothetical protein